MKTYYPPKKDRVLDYYPYKNFFIVPFGDKYKIVSPGLMSNGDLFTSVLQAKKTIDKTIIEK